MKFLVLLNQMDWMPGGQEPEAARRQLAEAFAAAGADAEVRAVDSKFIPKHAKEAMESDVDAIVAGGSAGTLHRIASTIVDGRKVLGVLPMGAESHLARELGMPLELNEAVSALACAKVIEMPVAEVNGLLFLSYVAIGYAPALGNRVDAEGLLNRMAGRMCGLRVSTRGHEVTRCTPSLVVSNNASQVRAFGIATAPPPERELMNVYVADRLGVVSRFLNGRSAMPRFRGMALPDFRVDAPRRRRVQVSIDGMVTSLQVPVRFKMRERPMRVLAGNDYGSG